VFGSLIVVLRGVRGVRGSLLLVLRGVRGSLLVALLAACAAA
jgi:hypothetical protein